MGDAGSTSSSCSSAAPRLSAAGLYNDLGTAYASAFADLPDQAASIKWIISQLEQHKIKPARILDIGCGTGRPVCAAFAYAGHDVLGIDISSAMLNAARKQVPNAKFAQIDVRDFSVPPSTFDVITVYFGLIDGVSQDDIRQSIREIHTWLKPGGLFVFATVPQPASSADFWWLGRPIVYSSFASEDVVGLIEKVGFEVVDTKESSFMPKAVEAGICGPEDVDEEPHLFVRARKPT